MKKTAIAILLTSLCFLSGAMRVAFTDFTMTVTIMNKSGVPKQFFLEKGRILEISQIDATHFQSIIITEGDGWIDIPPHTTVQRVIKGICLHKGLRFPQQGAPIVLTPFLGNAEYIAAGENQEEVHKITALPADNVQIIIAKGYSDDNNDGKEKDREEAFKNAVENASRESGFIFTSETILNNLRMIQTKQRITIEEKSIRLNKMIHEEYDEETGEFLYIGEFEVRSKPSRPEIK